MIIDEIKEWLIQAQSLRGHERRLCINKICDLVWDDMSVQDDKLNDILTDIAYILEDYEPNEEWRKASLSYYGDERLEREIKSALQKLEQYASST